ncbi:MAG: eS25 family ribosomal protein [bacterium]
MLKFSLLKNKISFIYQNGKFKFLFFKGKTNADKDKDKKKADTKKKPAMKDILAKKSSSGKNKKKKWSRTKAKEKLNNSVFWTKAAYTKLTTDTIMKEPYITPSLISEKAKVNVSLARAALQEMIKEGTLVPYNNDPHSKWGLYVKSSKAQVEADKKAVEDAGKDTKKGGEKKQKK